MGLDIFAALFCLCVLEGHQIDGGDMGYLVKDLSKERNFFFFLPFLFHLLQK